MKKLINSISFYFIAIAGFVLTLNENSNWVFNICGFLILVWILISFKNSTKEEIYDTLGITWLQKKFKNNKVIMDMTNE